MHLDSVPNERVSGWFLFVRGVSMPQNQNALQSPWQPGKASFLPPLLLFHPNLNKEGYQSSLKKMDRESEISQRDKTMTSKVLFFFLNKA